MTFCTHSDTPTHTAAQMSASLAPECNEVKERYDTCFLKWYSEKFVRGKATTDECAPLFAQYKQCLGKALKERGIDTMIEEARESNRENDAENMRPGCELGIIGEMFGEMGGAD